ncbi:cytochrome c oxidase assembly protein subunit 15 [Kineococcus xinjiangensis]|uniref:Cytochrome c oxidase assembly protein subunit 15 n=1 Tax=Kineococcus xinjiangensis TaxID=512762 RepID=A0A2S6IPF1_9ACTN|nr:cytochrome c oxidase assembly protein subunit 15 [Kineococcus xinjiangensis]
MGPWTSRLLLLNVVVECLIVVTGGVVRLTGSGLGCPTWPQCVPGSYTPVLEQAEGFHKYIEFGNRTLTGLVGLVALAAVIAVVRERRPDLLRWALPVLAGIAVQAVIGGITVLTGLHPATVMLHFLVSAVLIAVSTALWMRAQEPSGPRERAVPRPVRGLVLAAALVSAAVITVGTAVTGAGPHAGDADQPVRLAVDPRTLSWLHADLVMVFVGLVVGCVVALRLVPEATVARRRAAELLVVTLAQGAIGYAQYFTGLPEVLVGLHMAGACVLVVAMARLVLALTRPTLPRPA